MNKKRFADYLLFSIDDIIKVETIDDLRGLMTKEMLIFLGGTNLSIVKMNVIDYLMSLIFFINGRGVNYKYLDKGIQLLKLIVKEKRVLAEYYRRSKSIDRVSITCRQIIMFTDAINVINSKLSKKNKRKCAKSFLENHSNIVDLINSDCDYDDISGEIRNIMFSVIS